MYQSQSRRPGRSLAPGTATGPWIPPLRERRGDILLLCKYFIEKYGKKYASSVQTFPQDLLEACVWYDWPGNVRQLENIVKRQLILPDGDIISELRSPGRQMFWIVKHGIRNTAMLGWGNLLSDDEIWQVVTLIRKFDSLPDSATLELLPHHR